MLPRLPSLLYLSFLFKSTILQENERFQQSNEQYAADLVSLAKEKEICTAGIEELTVEYAFLKGR